MDPLGSQSSNTWIVGVVVDAGDHGHHIIIDSDGSNDVIPIRYSSKEKFSSE